MPSLLRSHFRSIQFRRRFGYESEDSTLKSRRVLVKSNSDKTTESNTFRRSFLHDFDDLPDDSSLRRESERLIDDEPEERPEQQTAMLTAFDSGADVRPRRRLTKKRPRNHPEHGIPRPGAQPCRTNPSDPFPD